jgi:putative aldouronate transport system permease protein
MAAPRVRALDVLLYAFLGAAALVTLYPFWDVVVVSLVDLAEYARSRVHLWPRRVDFAAYRFILGSEELWRSYGVTVLVTVGGTALNMALTVVTGYVLSKRLRGTRVIMFLIVFTMLFQGGLIPLYIVVRKTGLMNTLWALIVPTAILTWNLIIMRNFFSTIPESLEESARIDGAGDLMILTLIVVPLSMPAIATIGLFYAVDHWNEFFAAVMYITDRRKWPLQLFLRGLLFENEASTRSGGDDPYLLGMPVKMAAIAVASVPVMLVYPFFQRYFVKGILVGAVKG